MLDRVRHSFFRHLFVGATAAACVLSVTTAQAQSSSGPSGGVKFGVLLGANVSTISDADNGIFALVDGAFDKKKRIGFNGGVYATIPVTGILSLQPEVHYVQNGVTFEVSNADVSGKLGVKADYVEVPVLFRLESDGASRIRPFIVAGASAALRVRCAVGITGNGVSASQDCKTAQGETENSVADPFKKDNYSLVGGAGLSMLHGSRNVSLQVRYSHGLTNIASNDSDPNIQPKFRALSILLGIGM